VHASGALLLDLGNLSLVDRSFRRLPTSTPQHNGLEQGKNSSIIGYVWYIKILTRLQGFWEKLNMSMGILYIAYYNAMP
jgi:hypothetical protein